MSKIFCACKLLKEIPYISKWNINKVEEIDYLFGEFLLLDCSECSSLISLPGISNWNTQMLKICVVYFGIVLL